MQELESYVLSTTCQKQANDMIKVQPELDTKGSFVQCMIPRFPRPSLRLEVAATSAVTAWRVRSISLETLMFQRTACSTSQLYTQADKHLSQ